jgi:quinol monooxygenase YgiN
MARLKWMSIVRATMQRLLASIVCGGIVAMTAQAQGPSSPTPVPDGPRYIVTYLEVMPTATAEAVELVRKFRDATRKEAGNLRAEALQRIGQTHQFVLLEAWNDQAAADAHAKTLAVAQFREKLKAIENAPIDQRTHFVLSVGPIEAKSGGAPVAVVTHVDVVPPQRETGTAITKQLADDGRKDDGNLRFEALTQINRQNHFTVVELWRDQEAAATHSMAGHTRAFREKLAPASGALYDERYYNVLD